MKNDLIMKLLGPMSWMLVLIDLIIFMHLRFTGDGEFMVLSFCYGYRLDL